MCVDSLERSVAAWSNVGSHPVMSARAQFVADSGTRGSGTIDRGERERSRASRWDCSTGFGVGSRRVGADGRDPAADLQYLHQWVAEHIGRGGLRRAEDHRHRRHGRAGGRRRGVDPPQGRGRRRCPAAERTAQIPVYDVQKVGYPQRMRDYDARRRIERERVLREEARGR